MSPEVIAAIIAASVSVLTLIGTVIAQIIGFRSTKANTEQQIRATQKNTADTLEQQREQLDRTLRAQSDQLKRTLAEQRIRTLNERFATAAEQLGGDKPAIRLAGVYAMAGLADDWEENRQTCVDVLCAHLRMPYEPDPGQDAPDSQRLAFQAVREVRHTVIRVITAHLRRGAAVPWQGLFFDFNGVIFDGGDFREAEFSGNFAVFDNAEFSGGTVRFNRAKFSGGHVYFGGAKFSGGTVRFELAEFSGGEVSFRGAELSGGRVEFSRAKFSGAGKVNFTNAEFSGSTVDFSGAEFSGGTFDFSGAQFSGSEVDFSAAQFSGTDVDFSAAGNWSVPPVFARTNALPSSVKLPENKVTAYD
jgi:uncharacterized membrane-anchored protein YhcB (DUF1043 family)